MCCMWLGINILLSSSPPLLLPSSPPPLLPSSLPLHAFFLEREQQGSNESSWLREQTGAAIVPWSITVTTDTRDQTTVSQRLKSVCVCVYISVYYVQCTHTPSFSPGVARNCGLLGLIGFFTDCGSLSGHFQHLQLLLGVNVGTSQGYTAALTFMVLCD